VACSTSVAQFASHHQRMNLSLILAAACLVVVSRASNDVAVEDGEEAVDTASTVIDDVLDDDVRGAEFQAEPIDWSVVPEGPPVEFAVLVRFGTHKREKKNFFSLCVS